MIVYLSIRSAGSVGGNTTFSLIGQYLESGLGDYGSAIRQLEVTACFRGGKVRNPTLQRSFDEFHSKFLPQLPLVKFLRKRNRIGIQYETTLADASFLEKYGFLTVELFNVALKEVTEKLNLIRARLKPSDDFQVARFFEDIDRLVSQSPTRDEELKALREKVEQQWKSRRAAMDPWERLDIDWDEYHPAARPLLNDPFFWSEIDDFSPHGNDTGADLLGDFKKWNRRHSNDPAYLLATELLLSWNITSIDYQRASNEAEVESLLANDQIVLSVNNQTFIAVAFAAIKMRGACDRGTRELALGAIKCERLIAKIKADSWKHAPERQRTLDVIEDALIKAPETPSEA